MKHWTSKMQMVQLHSYTFRAVNKIIIMHDTNIIYILDNTLCVHGSKPIDFEHYGVSLVSNKRKFNFGKAICFSQFVLEEVTS